MFFARQYLKTALDVKKLMDKNASRDNRQQCVKDGIDICFWFITVGYTCVCIGACAYAVVTLKKDGGIPTQDWFGHVLARVNLIYVFAAGGIILIALGVSSFSIIVLLIQAQKLAKANRDVGLDTKAIAIHVVLILCTFLVWLFSTPVVVATHFDGLNPSPYLMKVSIVKLYVEALL